MMEENTAEKLTRENESRVDKIARVAARLPEREQEQILYMIQGYALLKGTEQRTGQALPRAAAI